MEQAASPWLERAGRTVNFAAMVMVPNAASATNRLAVDLSLHGYGGMPNFSDTSCGPRIRLVPHDAESAYWWGSARLGDGGTPTSGLAPPYLHRRALSLLRFVLTRFHGDPERVTVTGGSMGGAGAMTIGLMHARHFARVQANSGQAIPRLHRPGRITTQARQWGSPASNLPAEDGGLGVWDEADLTRVLAELPEARHQHLRLGYNKDDPTIHFGALTFASPFTGRSLREAVRAEKVGSLIFWDESGHVFNPADPVLGSGWVDTGWNPITHPEAFLRRDLAFPAFTDSSLDEDPGDGGSNGLRSYNVNSGYAGTPSIAGDTGWNGAVAGALNRFLRWDARALVDTIDRFELPLRLVDGTGAPAPQAGYPTLGDVLPAPGNAVVDVTPRRVSGFLLLPGEAVRWEFGAATGTALADARGELTVPRLTVTTQWTTLRLTRL
mgnify:CR=1 FL=1